MLLQAQSLRIPWWLKMRVSVHLRFCKFSKNHYFDSYNCFWNWQHFGIEWLYKWASIAIFFWTKTPIFLTKQQHIHSFLKVFGIWKQYFCFQRLCFVIHFVPNDSTLVVTVPRLQRLKDYETSWDYMSPKRMLWIIMLVVQVRLTERIFQIF
jgi:hypothetical protein